MHAENKSLEKSTMVNMFEGRKGRGRSCMCLMDGLKAATKLSLPKIQDAACSVGMVGDT